MVFNYSVKYSEILTTSFEILLNFKNVISNRFDYFDFFLSSLMSCSDRNVFFLHLIIHLCAEIFKFMLKCNIFTF